MFSTPRASGSRNDVENGKQGGRKFDRRRPRANESAKEQTLGPQRSVIIITHPFFPRTVKQCSRRPSLSIPLFSSQDNVY